MTGQTTAPTGAFDYRKAGADIYAESFRIIRSEANLDRFPADVERVVVRMCHAAGDVTIADEVDFSPGVVGAAHAALVAGAPILCDSTMVATGIIRSRLPAANDVVCLLQEAGLADLATQRGTTKTATAVELWAERGLLGGSVVAIGNAPTALFRLLELVAAGADRPAAVFGIPVGFVGAAESKQALVDSGLGLDYLVVRGRRGGSAMTVAAVNATASSAE